MKVGRKLKNISYRSFPETGFFLAFILFIVLVVLFFCMGGIDPFYEIIINNKIGNEKKDIISMYVFIDTVLIIGWFLGWIGIYDYMIQKNNKYCLLIFIVGIMGPILDFIENEISWVIIHDVYTPQSILNNVWLIIQRLSYIFPYLGAILLGISIIKEKKYNKYYSLFLIYGSIIALSGLYFDMLFIPSQAWWPLFFLLSGIFIIKNKPIDNKSTKPSMV